MNTLALLRRRFATALEGLTPESDRLALLVMPSQDPKFGDYQANCSMSLGKELGQSPRKIAQQIVDRLDLAGLCHPPQIAGPGFINLRLSDEWLADRLGVALGDSERLGMGTTDRPRTCLIDFSSPNVAKSLHVGHIRSTVIGDSVGRLLRFLGHTAITDNHLGDWGTQFGMILYGYKHFLDRDAYQRDPMEELGRLYRLVHALADYHEIRRDRLPALVDQVERAREEVARLESSADDTTGQKKGARDRKQARRRLAELEQQLAGCRTAVKRVEDDPERLRLAAEHVAIGTAVLEETAKLHVGDAENQALWREFLPPCMAGIDAIYARLGVSFDHTLGESFYHDALDGVVRQLQERGLAVESDGALCVFLDGSTTPMIVRKKDGAFLYATTDLATIEYRMRHFHPDAILYVVGQPQSLHFEQLFATARLWGYDDVELTHIRFGTVLDDEGRPFRTRSGDVVGLTGLLDEAVDRAHQIVTQNDDARPEPRLSPEMRRRVAETVGIGALKYADLSHNRESDYVFSYDKMLAMKGNTATAMQYAYARVQSIFEKGRTDPETIRRDSSPLRVGEPAERALAVAILQLSEAVERAADDYRPSHLTAYLFDLAGRFAEFFEQCPVLRANSEVVRTSRLKLCDLTARTLKLGLSLLGIDVVERM